MYKPMRKSIFFGALLAMICFSSSTNASTTNHLPVKFIRFYVDLVGEDVRVRWTTDSEYDNDFFTVERSKDMILWETLEIVPGAGTSPGAGEYQYMDMEPKKGINHYRIKQTDLNGAYDYSHIEKVEVDFLYDIIAEVAVAPNPLPGSSDSFIIKGESSLAGVTVKLIDISGKEIKINTDLNDTELRVTPFIKMPGLYFLIIQKREKSIVKKIKFE